MLDVQNKSKPVYKNTNWLIGLKELIRLVQRLIRLLLNIILNYASSNDKEISILSSKIISRCYLLVSEIH